MPFNSSGTYTPPAGATTAAPGDVIQSAIWNSIFTDISTALTELGSQTYNVTTVTTTPYTVLSTDTYLAIFLGSAVTINLPSVASRGAYPLVIKDVSGAASTNHITIVPNLTDLIEGASSLVINSNWGGYSLKPITNGWAITL